MCSQKVSRAAAALAGMHTVCWSTRVAQRSAGYQASRKPWWAGAGGLLSPIATPRPVQPRLPSSNPPLTISSPGAGGGSTVMVRVSVPWAPVPSRAVKVTRLVIGAVPGFT